MHLINDAAHGFIGSSGVGQVCLQGCQPVFQPCCSISATKLASTTCKEFS